jgi:predicted RNA polymerase sigma factor
VLEHVSPGPVVTLNRAVALAGDTAGARECYRRAARMTTSVAERQYLALRAASLS